MYYAISKNFISNKISILEIDSKEEGNAWDKGYSLTISKENEELLGVLNKEQFISLKKNINNIDI